MKEIMINCGNNRYKRYKFDMYKNITTKQLLPKFSQSFSDDIFDISNESILEVEQEETQSSRGRKISIIES